MNLFIEKIDLNGGTYQYYSEGMAENTKQAVVKLTTSKMGLGIWELKIQVL